MFLRHDGKEWKRIDASRAMRRACKTAKIAPPAVFHDLRLSYGSLPLNRGAEAEVIRELPGHADLRMTRRAYAHHLNSTVAEAAEWLPNSCCVSVVRWPQKDLVHDLDR